jgi:hypothetical protein
MGGELSILSVCIGVRGRVLSVSFSVIVCVYTVDGKYTCGGYGDLTPPKVVGDSDAQLPSVLSERDKTTTIIGAAMLWEHKYHHF